MHSIEWRIVQRCSNDCLQTLLLTDELLAEKEGTCMDTLLESRGVMSESKQ